MSSPSPIVDRVLKKLLAAEKLTRDTRVKLLPSDISCICQEAIKAFQKDPVLLQLEAPITICGDIHGQFYDLLNFFKLGGMPPDTNYLFMGDYVDRGMNSVETFTLLLCFKILYPDKFWMLRGNHETKDISQLYGFFDECSTVYSIETYNKFVEVFDYIPIAAVISERIFCVHGGLSRELTDLKQIENMKRPLHVPEEGLLTDLLWADPSNEHNGYQESERGTSYSFGPDVAREFLEKNDFDLICRAHQVVDNGFDFPFAPEQTVLTVFSAPDYCQEFMNKGALLKVDEELRCSFKFIDPPKHSTLSQMRPATPGNIYF